MKIDEIKAIAEIVAANDLAELKLERDGFSLEIKRGGNTVVAAAPVAVAMPAAAAVPAAAPAPAAAAAPAESAANRITIDSPLVGTLYRAPSPEAAPFVKVGDKVTPDTVVCIVEAMKVMNEIKAEKSGVIRDILVENGSAVEFGQPLFVIE
ncbi:MAG: acetyl-CoA carboxylase biotin carboxyl carrier protein [Lentisphaerae bacterium]|nr:acetyl-CoA carboxylase biotin carboxyl carrier protein [Lentisphaerota bacterium]